MKKTLFKILFILFLFVNQTMAVSEAGALFLLISPGARAGGMGEAQVAVANDAYASYWNPAGLAFLSGSELALMHVNWLPNLVSDMYYEFVAGRHEIPSLGTLGGHLIFLNLGEQVRTDEEGNTLGTFISYMYAFTGSYGARISKFSSIGLNVKLLHQKLSEYGTAGEEGKGISTDFAFDFGYLKKRLWTPKLDFGFTITNIGPKVAFIDEAQADPMPTNMALGIKYKIIDSQYNKLSFVLDVNKMLVGAYPDMDWDSDGKIGGYDKDGRISPLKDPGYNKKGQLEIAHTDPIYLGIFTSWLDDWYLGGDIDMPGKGGTTDGVVGGYNIDSTGKVVQDDPNAVWGDPNYGKYNNNGVLEVGSGDNRSFSNELDELIYNFGFEYWYSEYFAIRVGYYWDKIGKINNLTFGVGLRFSGYGFDFGFTSGEQGHPLTNTMRFSLNMEF